MTQGTVSVADLLRDPSRWEVDEQESEDLVACEECGGSFHAWDHDRCPDCGNEDF